MQIREINVKEKSWEVFLHLQSSEQGLLAHWSIKEFKEHLDDACVRLVLQGAGSWAQ